LFGSARGEIGMIMGNERNSGTESSLRAAKPHRLMCSCKEEAQKETVGWLRQHDRNASPEPSIHHHCLIQINTQQNERKKQFLTVKTITNEEIKQNFQLIMNLCHGMKMLINFLCL
jgi:hypothetical protein